MNENNGGNAEAVVGFIVFIVALGLFFGAIGFFTSLATVPQGEVGFAIGGGPFDGARQKVKGDLLDPGRHVTGTLDGLWTFPANRTLRFQDFDLTVTTLDGKKVELQGQIAFRFVGEKDPTKAREFATGIGARKYGGHRPGEDGTGWSKFLDQMVTPEANATFKEQFGTVYCADFEPACRSIDPRANIPQANPERVYTAVSRILQERVDTKLGDSYLRDIRVRVNRIVLPGEVQQNIDRVTAEQARTKAAQQAAVTAEAEAKAIRTKGAALRSNRSLIALEVAKACNDRCTVIVDASGKTPIAVGK